MLLGIAVLVLALDITSKLLVVANLSDDQQIRLLGGFLTLRESRNLGRRVQPGHRR